MGGTMRDLNSVAYRTKTRIHRRDGTIEVVDEPTPELAFGDVAYVEFLPLPSLWQRIVARIRSTL